MSLRPIIDDIEFEIQEIQRELDSFEELITACSSRNPDFIETAALGSFLICPRQSWLMFRQLNADQRHTSLELGRLTDDTTYEREKKKVYLADVSAMVDMVTQKDGEVFIAEIKRSSKRIENAIKQLKYYLFLLRRKSVIVKGMLKIPKEKKSIEVELSGEDVRDIERSIDRILAELYKSAPPPRAAKKICKKCAHLEFCWS